MLHHFPISKSMKTKMIFQHLLLFVFTGAGIAGVLEEPKISVEKYIDVDAGQMAVCEVTNVMTSESLLMTMQLGGTKLSTTQSRTANIETAQALITPKEPGTYLLECSVTLHGETKNASVDVLVYRFPEPVITTEDEDYDDDDEPTLSITCKLPDASPNKVSINITVENTPLTCKGNEPLQRICTIPAKKEHNGKNVNCEARMSAVDKIMTKNKMEKLNIEYAAEFRDDRCPTNQTLTEGQKIVFFCKADGNPPPKVICSKAGTPENAGWIQQVTRNHSGSYYCTASNKHDKEMRNVTIVVKLRNLAILDRSSFGSIFSVMALAGLLCHFF